MAKSKTIGFAYWPFRSANKAEAFENHETRAAAYVEVFSTVEGRRVLADILIHAGCNREPLVPGQPDTTAHNLGQLRLARIIVENIVEGLND